MFNYTRSSAWVFITWLSDRNKSRKFKAQSMKKFRYVSEINVRVCVMQRGVKSAIKKLLVHELFRYEKRGPLRKYSKQLRSISLQF